MSESDPESANIVQKDLVNEVYRRIGRNIILFQQLELLFKQLVISGDISGNVHEIQKNVSDRVSKISSQTLGQVVGQFIDIHDPNVDVDEMLLTRSENKLNYFSTVRRVEYSQEDYEAKKAMLADMVAERNQLVHHLLSAYDLNSVESCKDLLEHLDKQKNKVQTEINISRAQLGSMIKAAVKVYEFICSVEWEKQEKLSVLRQSLLANILGDVADQMKRPDGWTVINTAGNLLKEHAPNEYSQLQEKYGYRKLKEFILATELFDLKEESTVKGGTRVLYRLKPNWKLVPRKDENEDRV